MNNRLLTLLSLTLPVVVIWGLNFAVIRVGVTNVGPFTLGALRFAVASVPFLFFVARPKAPLAFLLCYGILFGFAQFTFLFVGMKIGLPTGIASLLLQLQAVFTPALAFLLLREQFSRYTALAMVMSLAGLAAILSKAGHVEGGIVPVLFGVGAAAWWAMSNVVVRFGVWKGYEYKPISLVVWASLVPVVPFSILAWTTGEISPALWNGLGSGLVSAVYLGLLGTVVGYMLWVRALSVFDGATVAPFSLMIPVIGQAAGYLIFNEKLGWAEVAGSLLIVAGVLVHVVGTARRAPALT
jgi:O-acetylserine/cysteine efflux transporter